jgi:hypothetical protein
VQPSRCALYQVKLPLKCMAGAVASCDPWPTRAVAQHMWLPTCPLTSLLADTERRVFVSRLSLSGEQSDLRRSVMSQKEGRLQE